MMEDLRFKLEQAIEMYGTMDKKVLELSQKLDIEMCNAQKRILLRGSKMIEFVSSKEISLKEKIIARITRLESYIHEDDTPAIVKDLFKNELEHLRAELKRS